MSSIAPNPKSIQQSPAPASNSLPPNLGKAYDSRAVGPNRKFPMKSEPDALPFGRAFHTLSFYNRDEEIDFALAQMEDILATREWETHLQPA